jgi:hypothetical protein
VEKIIWQRWHLEKNIIVYMTIQKI